MQPSTPGSLSLQTIDRINKKISSLTEILSPVVVPIGTNTPNSVPSSGSELVSSLESIDGRLAHLIDSISI